jgi:hypothetical protein
MRHWAFGTGGKSHGAVMGRDARAGFRDGTRGLVVTNLARIGVESSTRTETRASHGNARNGNARCSLLLMCAEGKTFALTEDAACNSIFRQGCREKGAIGLADMQALLTWRVKPVDRSLHRRFHGFDDAQRAHGALFTERTHVEADIPALEPRAQAPSRLSRTDGNQGRAQDPERPSRARPQVAERLIPSDRSGAMAPDTPPPTETSAGGFFCFLAPEPLRLS